MTSEDDITTERGRDEFVAAEYVLGVLDAAERRTVSERIENDIAFARVVDTWEVHFAPLASEFIPIEPPASIKSAVDHRLFASGSVAAGKPGSLWASLALWRGLAAGAAAAFLVAIALPFLNPPVQAPQSRYVASLAADASDVKYLAVYDQNDAQVSLAHVSGAKASDRDFELWMIEGSKAPVSMGVLPSGETIKITLSPEVRAKLAAGAVLAISLEPSGGSPTGQPTGPVVAAGDLKSI